MSPCRGNFERTARAFLSFDFREVGYSNMNDLAKFRRGLRRNNGIAYQI